MAGLSLACRAASMGARASGSASCVPKSVGGCSVWLSGDHVSV